MLLALQSFLEEATVAVARYIWQALADTKIDSTHIDIGARPHITTGSWDIRELNADLKNKLKQTAQKIAPLSIELSLKLREYRHDNNSLCGIYLIPEHSTELENFHAQVHELFGKVGDFYRPQDIPGAWIPHLSLCFGIDSNREEEAMKICNKIEIPLKSSINYLGLVLFHPIRFYAVESLTGKPA